MKRYLIILSTLYIFITFSFVSGFEFEFSDKVIQMEDLGLHHVYSGHPVEVTVQNPDGSKFTGDCDISVYLVMDSHRPELYRGLRYSSSGENLIRFPFAIAEKYDIIYLKAWFDTGEYAECFRRIPKEEVMPDKVSGKGLTEDIIVWYGSNFHVEDCRITRGDDNVIRIGFSLSGMTSGPVPTEAHSFYMIYNSSGEFTDSFGYIGSASADGNSSVSNTMFSPSGEMIYYKVTGELEKQILKDNLPGSWSYYSSGYGTSGFVNGTEFFNDEMFSSRSMTSNVSCDCCWILGDFPIVGYYDENLNIACGEYRLKKESGSKGEYFTSSNYHYMDRLSYSGESKVYTYINYNDSVSSIKCNPTDDLKLSWSPGGSTRFYEQIIKGSGFEKKFDYFSNWISDVGIISRDSVNRDVIFWVNNGVLYWNLWDEALTQTNIWNYGFEYIKV
ncbi:MAG TPA: hypothetical protein ENN73_04650, partial [Firmicutes bacterium]|nr:hypothetical protein [Bacillota bacterium]